MKARAALALVAALVALGTSIALRHRPLPRYGAALVRTGKRPPELVVYQKPDRHEKRGLAWLERYLDRMASGNRAILTIQREDDAPGLIVCRRFGETEIVLAIQTEPSRPERERRIEGFFRARGGRGRPGILTPIGRKPRPSEMEYPLPATPEGRRALVSDALRELFGVGPEDGLSYELEVSGRRDLSVMERGES